jgi:hypothetical protein
MTPGDRRWAFVRLLPVVLERAEPNAKVALFYLKLARPEEMLKIG